MSKKIAIEVTGLSKSFRLPTEKSSELKQSVVNFFRGIKGYKEQKVLKNISFVVEEGDFFGIVGRNGSGKSTLLKLLSGIYQPDKGAVRVNGSLIPFIELGVGFSPELTGRENIYLNGALLGFSEKEVDGMYDEIVDFAELHDFMGQKLKNYSSGMQVRLAFSIAIRAKSDILILDEVLAVGDEAFQRKCLEYFSDLKKGGQTIVLVTHDMGVVERFCNKAILVERGKILTADKPLKIARLYSELLSGEKGEAHDGEVEKIDSRFGTGEVVIVRPKLEMLDDDKTIRLKLRLETKKPLAGRITVAYTVKDAMGAALFGNRHELKKLSTNCPSKVDVEILSPNYLNSGLYYVDVSVYLPEQNLYTDCWIDAIKFRLRSGSDYATPIMVRDKFAEKNVEGV